MTTHAKNAPAVQIFTASDERLLRISEVLNRTGLKKSLLYQGVLAGWFPKPIKLSPGGRACAWRESQVQNYITTRIAESQ